MSTKQQNITIRIADVNPISMSIPANSEEIVRLAEFNVNRVWNKWRKDFPERNSKEILAMMALHIARNYYQLLEQVNSQQTILKEFEDELDRLLNIGSEVSADSSPNSVNG